MESFPHLALRNGLMKLNNQLVLVLLECGNLGFIMLLLMLVMLNKLEVLLLLLLEVEGNSFIIFRYYLWNDQP